MQHIQLVVPYKLSYHTQKLYNNNFNVSNVCYHLIQYLLSSKLISKNSRLNIQNYNFAYCFVWV